MSEDLAEYIKHSRHFDGLGMGDQDLEQRAKKLQARIDVLEAEVNKLNQQGRHFGEFIEVIWPLTALKTKILEKHPEFADLITELKKQPDARNRGKSDE
jgi:hypothetical protein